MNKYSLAIILLTLNLFIVSGVNASPGRVNTSLDVLKKEVTRLIQKNKTRLADMPEQDIEVGFLINAKNELIILDVNGDSTSACEYVKQILNYNKVKFCQAKQLTRYSIKIHLVKEK
ncbi:MAG: hypothetical protein ABJC12_04935 [Saprospiraceae bacterium]